MGKVLILLPGMWRQGFESQNQWECASSPQARSRYGLGKRTSFLFPVKSGMSQKWVLMPWGAGSTPQPAPTSSSSNNPNVALNSQRAEGIPALLSN